MTVHFPASDQIFNIGLGSVAVPGNLRGFLHVHERLGTLPLSELLAPAVRLARGGVELNALQAYVMRLLEPINTLTPAGRALFRPQGTAPAEGDRLANPDLASFLESLPDSGRDFYGGELARRIARDMREGRGLLTQRDLAAYSVAERVPLALRYRGHRLLTNPPPSFGGSLIALSLRLHEGQQLAELGWGTGGHLCALAAVMQEVDRLREEKISTPELLSDERRAESAVRLRRATGGTTHVSVSDAAGNAASLSLSNGEGSGYLAPDTGVMLNNMLGEDDLHPDGFHGSPPGERVSSMMSPCLLLRRGGVRLIVGSGGSKRIRTALVQVIGDVVDFDLDVGAAVEAPRIHWDGEQVQVEPGFDAAAVGALRGRWPVNLWQERNLYFGGVHAVDPAGAGAGDPRRGGHSASL
jgi:gamma-glutamyltranspeptidase/glutathione hydrolase